MPTSPSFHPCLILDLTPSDITQSTQQQKLSLRSHTAPAPLGFLACYPEIVLKNQPYGFISSSAQLPYQCHQLLEFRAISRTGDRN